MPSIPFNPNNHGHRMIANNAAVTAWLELRDVCTAVDRELRDCGVEPNEEAFSLGVRAAQEFQCEVEKFSPRAEAVPAAV
jgi:hypothetical protein